MNLSPSNWNMLYWKWHEYSMNLSPFYFYEYSWLRVCVQWQQKVATGDNPSSLSSSSHSSPLSFISPVLCHHSTISLHTSALFRVLLSSTRLLTILILLILLFFAVFVLLRIIWIKTTLNEIHLPLKTRGIITSQADFCITSEGKWFVNVDIFLSRCIVIIIRADLEDYVWLKARRCDFRPVPSARGDTILFMLIDGQVGSLIMKFKPPFMPQCVWGLRVCDV